MAPHGGRGPRIEQGPFRPRPRPGVRADGSLTDLDENGNPRSWFPRGDQMKLQYMSGHRFHPYLPWLPPKSPTPEDQPETNDADGHANEDRANPVPCKEHAARVPEPSEFDYPARDVFPGNCALDIQDPDYEPSDQFDDGEEPVYEEEYLEEDDDNDENDDDDDDEEDHDDEEGSDDDEDTDKDDDKDDQSDKDQGEGEDSEDEEEDDPDCTSNRDEDTDSDCDHDEDAGSESEDAMEIDSEDEFAFDPASYFLHRFQRALEFDTEPIDQEEQFQARPAIRIVIPDNLKSLIVDDWERVSKNGTVVDLPAPRPIRQIFNEYRDEEAPKRGSRIDRDVLDEIIVGLSEYFEVMLDKVLLYRYERAQYRQLCERHSNQEDHGPVAVYGAEHLLRLFSMFTSHLPICSSYVFFRLRSGFDPI